MAVVTLRRGLAWSLFAVAAGLLALALKPGPSPAAPMAAAVKAPIVVELFTSQGCSSCPPADALLGELAKRDDVLPLAFHIDYWDRLGWKDPFSLPEATARQRAYARSLGNGNVYTPQMVVNGAHDVVGSDRAKVARAIAEAAKATVPLELRVVTQSLSVAVGAGMGSGQLWLVSFDPKHETQVRAGENAGRKLVNVNIVRKVEPLGAWNGAAQAFEYPLPVTGSNAAVLLQASDGRILGAAAIRLPAAS